MPHPLRGSVIDTPGLATRVHLNNAGAALMPAVVSEAITAHIARESTTGGYESADAVASELAATYDALAELTGTAARNIAVTSSATHAFAQALSAFDFSRGDVILTSSNDYISNQLMFLSLARRCGVRIVRAPESPAGGVDVDAFAMLLRRERPKLATLTWVPTNSGLIQPAAEVGAACRAAGVPLILDACQAVGQVEIDVRSLQCDYLAATARKFLRGPRGIGFLVVSDEALARGDHPLLVDMRGARWTAADTFDLVDDARRFEEWELPHALVLGLGAAARLALQIGVAAGGARAHELAAKARELLARLPGVRVLDHGAHLSALATFELAGHDAHEIMLALRAQGINTSAQSRADAVIDLDRKQVTSLLRVSPHYYNDEAELERMRDALARLLGDSAHAFA